MSTHGKLETRLRLVWTAFRRRPELLFAPFAALWLLVNVAPWGFGPDYLYSFYLAFTGQKSDIIFPYTYAFAVTSFVGIFLAGLRWSRLGLGRTFLVAGTVPFAGPGVFEIIFQEAGARFHPGLFIGYAQPYVMLSYGTWVVLGLTGLGWWRLTWRWGVSLAYTVGGFLIWFAIGFPLVSTGSFAQVPWAYFFNISLKASCFLVFAVPIADGMFGGQRAEQNGQLSASALTVGSPGAVPPRIEDPVLPGPHAATIDARDGGGID